MFSISAFFMKLKYNTILLYSGEDGSDEDLEYFVDSSKVGQIISDKNIPPSL